MSSGGEAQALESGKKQRTSQSATSEEAGCFAVVETVSDDWSEAQAPKFPAVDGGGGGGDDIAAPQAAKPVQPAQEQQPAKWRCGRSPAGASGCRSAGSASSRRRCSRKAT